MEMTMTRDMAYAVIKGRLKISKLGDVFTRTFRQLESVHGVICTLINILDYIDKNNPDNLFYEGKDGFSIAYNMLHWSCYQNNTTIMTIEFI